MARAEISTLPEIERRNPYEEWQAKEGIPIVRGLCIENLNAVELRPWARKG